MKTLGGFAIALLAVGSLTAQNRAGFVNSGSIVRTPSSVVFPGGTSAMPGVQRTTGSVVYPGGGGPQIGIPSAITSTSFGIRGGQFFGGRPQARTARLNGAAVFAYPVYVGGGYPYLENPYGPEAAPQQPNVTVIMPPQQPPVVINQFGSAPPVQSQMLTLPQQESAPAEDQPAAASPTATHYLIAFKDHTIYSAVAYWVDGDTLHYFTSGNTHNQVSVSLVDRALTERLNRESGLEVKLPPAK